MNSTHRSFRAGVARLVQEFSGGYHLVGPDGTVARFSLSLEKALAYAQARGWEVR